MARKKPGLNGKVTSAAPTGDAAAAPPAPETRRLRIASLCGSPRRFGDRIYPVEGIVLPEDEIAPAELARLRSDKWLKVTEE